MAIIRNSYPWILENAMAKLYISQIQKLNAIWFPRIIAAFRKDIELDTDLDDVLAQYNHAGANYPLSSYEADLKRIINNLNFWSHGVLTRQIETQAAELVIPTIPIRLSDEGVRSVLKSVIDRNADLITQIIKENVGLVSKEANLAVIESVSELTKGAITRGDSVRTLSKAIKEATNVIQTKADFWARDQLKLGYRDVQNVRLKQAEIPGYIWSSVVDGRVRAEHRAKHGNFYEENQLSIEPGDDYNCRCVKIPAYNPDQQYSESRKKRDRAFMARDEKEAIEIQKAVAAKKKERRAKQARTVPPKQKAKNIKRQAKVISKANDRAKKLRKINRKASKTIKTNPEPISSVTFNDEVKKLDEGFFN